MTQKIQPAFNWLFTMDGYNTAYKNVTLDELLALIADEHETDSKFLAESITANEAMLFKEVSCNKYERVALTPPKDSWSVAVWKG